jgi:hypothetical protein
VSPQLVTSMESLGTLRHCVLSLLGRPYSLQSELRRASRTRAGAHLAVSELKDVYLTRRFQDTGPLVHDVIPSAGRLVKV